MTPPGLSLFLSSLVEACPFPSEAPAGLPSLKLLWVLWRKLFFFSGSAQGKQNKQTQELDWLCCVHTGKKTNANPHSQCDGRAGPEVPKVSVFTEP